MVWHHVHLLLLCVCLFLFVLCLCLPLWLTREEKVESEEARQAGRRSREVGTREETTSLILSSASPSLSAQCRTNTELRHHRILPCIMRNVMQSVHCKLRAMQYWMKTALHWFHLLLHLHCTQVLHWARTLKMSLCHFTSLHHIVLHCLSAV